jgi:hypothetical protein
MAKGTEILVALPQSIFYSYQFDLTGYSLRIPDQDKDIRIKTWILLNTLSFYSPR